MYDFTNRIINKQNRLRKILFISYFLIYIYRFKYNLGQKYYAPKVRI